MSQVHPLFVSRELSEERGLRKDPEFAWTARGVVASPCGDRHVLTLFEHFFTNRAGERRRSVDHVMTRFAPDGAPVRQAVVEGLNTADAAPCALPDGRFLVTGRDNVTMVVGADLASAALATGTGRWAARARLTPSGRAVCLGGGVAVAVTETPLTADPLPALRPVTTFATDYAREFPAAPPTFGPGGGDLAALLREKLGYRMLYGLWDAVPLDDETFVVAVVSRTKYLRQRGGDFVFALIGADGSWKGLLDLDAYRDGAGRGTRYDVAVARGRRIVHLNTFGLYVFDDTGARLARLPAEEGEYKALKAFRLHGVDPDGSLLLVHEKQNLLVTIPVPDDLADLPAAVAGAMAAFPKARSALKRRHEVVSTAHGWQWIADF
ncbi:hypothetical protein [Actinomadura kijaniata]|uniref:hypothetical protein n=1 Tax=Actinomadura kijaniata TaxID=46161 RepID=UPI000AE0DFD2|nr:hypothetical protein [Actinomadura kijaniata]